MSKHIHVHIGKRKVKDADPKVAKLKDALAAVKRTISDGERALEKGDLELAGRYFISAALTLEHNGKLAKG